MGGFKCGVYAIFCNNMDSKNIEAGMEPEKKEHSSDSFDVELCDTACIELNFSFQKLEMIFYAIP